MFLKGGVLSPLLYTLYVSSITDSLSKHLSVLQFADEIVLFSKISPIKRCKSLIEKSIKDLKINLRSVGLDLCAHKTVLMHFNRNQHPLGEIEIKIDDIIIKSSYSAKFLGILYDCQMTFSPHITYVPKKCINALNIIKFLCGTWWGSDPITLITFYKSFVRSHIDYGSFLYYPTRKNISEKLEKYSFWL